MTTGFGRKGISPSTATPPSSMPARGGRSGHAGESDLSPQMAAFLADERARLAQESNDRQAYAGDIDRVSNIRGNAKTRRSMIVAYVLWWFSSPLAAHRFYLRAYQSAFAMIALFWGGLALGLATGSGIPALFIGLWFIWVIADLFLIPGLTRKANESEAYLAFA